MKRLAAAALALFLTAGCTTGRVNARLSLARKQPQRVEPARWRPISTSEVARQDFAKALDELLRVTGPNLLWPGFTLDDHGVILVDNRRPSAPEVVCVGFCGRKSRLWKLDAPPKLPEALVFAAGADWALPRQEDVVVAPFDGSDASIFVVLHEDFHLCFQSDYTEEHPDAFEPPKDTTSKFTRQLLEHSYVADAEILHDVRGECAALTAALRAAIAHDQATCRAELARFVDIREARRAKPGAPSFEEDYWERLEGIPTNLEHRMAAMLRIRDCSVIQSALDRGCDIAGPISYFIVLGGLEAALLDQFEPSSWPAAVYPAHGRSASLYELLRKYAAPRERNGP